MNEDGTIRGDTDKENLKYLYRNFSQCYLNTKISIRTGFPFNPAHHGEMEVYLLSKALWNIRRLEEDVNLHQHRCDKQKSRIFCLYFLSFILYCLLSSFSLSSICSFFSIFAPSFPHISPIISYTKDILNNSRRMTPDSKHCTPPVYWLHSVRSATFLSNCCSPGAFFY